MTQSSQASLVGYAFRVAHDKRDIVTQALQGLASVSAVESRPLARDESSSLLRREWPGIAVLAHPEDAKQVEALGKVLSKLEERLPKSFTNRGLRRLAA